MVSLQLGPKGGGIEVGNGFELDWDSTISGAGAFTKEVMDTSISFHSKHHIHGTTSVTGGRLEVSSSNPTTATCTGTGASSYAVVELKLLGQKR